MASLVLKSSTSTSWISSSHNDETDLFALFDRHNDLLAIVKLIKNQSPKNKIILVAPILSYQMYIIGWGFSSMGPTIKSFCGLEDSYYKTQVEQELLNISKTIDIYSIELYAVEEQQSLIPILRYKELLNVIENQLKIITCRNIS